MREEKIEPSCCCTTRVPGPLSRIARSEPAQHLRNARREILLAAKSAIEVGLRRLDERDEALASDHDEPQAHKVDIE